MKIRKYTFKSEKQIELGFELDKNNIFIYPRFNMAYKFFDSEFFTFSKKLFLNNGE